MATTFRPEQLDEGSAEEQQQIQQAPRINSELFNAKVASNVVISAAARMSRFTQRIILQMLNRLQASK
jgi:hypothetical protein